MSTQTKSGGGGRNKTNKSSNANAAHPDTANKKVSDHKTEKEKPQIKVSYLLLVFILRSRFYISRKILPLTADS